jgi:hypothetical protein
MTDLLHTGSSADVLETLYYISLTIKSLATEHKGLASVAALLTGFVADVLP